MASVSKNLIIGAFAIGILALVVAFIFVPMMSAPTDGDSFRGTMMEEDTERVGSGIDLTVRSIDDTNGEVTVLLEDSQSGESVTVAEGGTETVTLEGGDVDVTLDSIELQDTAMVTVDFSSTHGWSEGSETVASNLHLLLALIALVIIGGLLVMVMK